MQEHNDTHPQLWNAGPVRILARSHKRGALTTLVVKRCAYVDADGIRCTKNARRAQAAKYCDEHTTSVGYVLQKTGAGVETRRCSCGDAFTNPRLRSLEPAPATRAWLELCPDCRRRSPLTCKRLVAHKVPYEAAKRWLELRDELCCERPGCGKRFTDTIRPQIDHDHAHCRGQTSCGECIRGVICQVCNNGLGQVEVLLRSCGFNELAEFLQTRCI